MDAIVIGQGHGHLLTIVPEYSSSLDVLSDDVFERLEKTFINRLHHVLEPSNTLYRGTRDTLYVLIPSSSEASALSAAHLIVEMASRPMLMAGHTIHLQTFIGVAEIKEATADGDGVLKNGRLALAEARKPGSGGVAVFNPKLLRQAGERQNLEDDIRRAVALGEFTSVYQPQFDIRQNSLVGFEALVRWSSNGRGQVSPAQFIPVAEEIGVIDTLGASVLRKACTDAARWPAHLTVSVNVSPLQLLQSDFEEIVNGALDAANLNPRRLELEVTEGVLLPRETGVTSLIDRLRQRGIRFALDDFGTGYSSLAYLQRFSFDKLKIDQAFVRSAPTKANRGILRAAVGIAKALDLKTIAEGVETEDQLGLVRDMGCDEVQGYLTGRPMTPEDAFTFANR